MSSGKVLFIDSVHPRLNRELESMGLVCVDATGWNREELLAQLDDATGLIIRSRFRLDRDLLQHARSLKFIGRAGSGMENIDVSFAASQGIACLNAPEANRDAVGEQAMGMLLMLMNRLRIADREVRQGVWLRDVNRGTELQGKTVGIIGFGNNGSAFARKLSGFDVKCLAYDPYIQISKQTFPGVQQVAMEVIFREADVVSFHVPLNETTAQLVNTDYLNQFQKPIWLVNTARGKILNTEALVQAMESGRVLGAALDVFEYESVSFESLDAASLPAPMRYLLESDRTVLTPHIAGWTHESHEKLSAVLVEKIRALHLI